MQVTITFEGTKPYTEIASALRSLAERWEGVTNTVNTVGTTATTTTKTTKAAKTATVENTDDETETFGLDVEETVYTQKDIIKAFQAYATEYSREKAAKVLTKFGVKSVKDLPQDQYAAVMEVLS